ncbi:serine/threonine-protein kinase [Streptomyces sp. LaPpAH-108]|uniref:serine/threonine-protein kinase n=1 Tax=Streptomyces sp. LaPpAH-108 TaxID=1155714 RepID=UPI000381E674|nr:serine/threonine-protein kinase [Streptomyces sp. LaPpAH-108]
MQGLLIAGRYRLADSIGSGGMGRVWRAHDEVLHRKVAIKELTAALYVSDSEQSVLLARTRAEARAAARINHSAVVTVHDVLEHDGRPWIVMELVEGESLADAVKERGRIEPREAARIGLWVLRALRAAHAAGVLHRDIKPGNVLLGRDRRVLLTDFGIAQIEGDATITRTGEVVGSVDYLAPERVRGHDPGPASDLWALGATLYTAVEGRSPFRRTSPLTTMQAVVEEREAPPEHAGPLGPVISALLQKEPALRPSAEDTERMLAEVAEGRAPRPAWVPAQQGGSPTVPTGLPGVPAASSTTTAAVAAPARTGLVRRRHRNRTVALVVVLAVVLGAGAAVGYQKWGASRHEASTGGAPHAPEPTGTATQGTKGTGGIPAGWERYDDPLGFSLSLPKGWKRRGEDVQGDLKQVDYSPDDGVHFVRIGIDSSPDFPDAYSHQVHLEGKLQGLVDYRQVRMDRNTYRDHQGSVWEYTWNALAKDPPYVAGPRHAIEETYISSGDVEYAIYLSTPEADWPETNRRFKWVLQSWQPHEG